ncbi:hypothetical protein J132_02632, partial [Termitomyces sp. J132]
GEFILGKGGKYLSSLNLSHNCVEFLPNLEHATHICLTLPTSKTIRATSRAADWTNPFHKGVSVTVAATLRWPTCPVTALKNLFAKFPCKAQAPLFEEPGGKALSYTYFVNAIRSALALAGLSPECFAGHSCGIGAASAAAAAGYSDYEVQLLGRWHSDSYKLYIKNDSSQILHLSSLLHMAFINLTPYKPPAL